MFRKYVIITLAAFMLFGNNACTSKKASDEAADSDSVSGDDSVESADATENNDDLDTTGDKKEEAVADMGGQSDDLAPEEKLPADPGTTQTADNAAVAPGDLSETPPAGDQAVAQNTPPGDANATPPPDAAAAAPAPSEPPPAPMADATPPPAPAADAAPAPAPEPVADAPKPAQASLKKVESAPFHRGGVLANAYYIAREGDTKDSIAQKVFGASSRVKDLCKANSGNCARPAKVGDKFYYNSPQRPTDETAMKSFYEDAGVAPMTYTAKAGDNIRTVGKTLLGNKRSWMELWATNDVESKGALDEGTTLKYWPNSEAPAPTQTMAKNDAGAAAAGTAAAGGGAPPAGGDQAGMPPGADAQAPPAPGGDQAMNTPPPPPSGADGAAAAASAPAPGGENLPPAPEQAANTPPPPAAGAAAAGTVEPPPPPPPPADMAQGHKEPAAVDAAGSDPNQTIALGVGAVLLLAAAALFISIRKKRARRQIDFNTSTQTQIE